MLVYRVEFRAPNDELVGMYQSGPDYESIWKRCTGGVFEVAYHPIPQESAELMDKLDTNDDFYGFDEFSFGFLNKRQFLQWVYDPKWRDSMTQNGGMLNVYEVDIKHTCVDNNQVMFIKPKATLIETLNVNHFDL